PPQEMEELARGRAVDDADVVLRRELEEALEARARVLGPVAFVAVRQQERQARRLSPLRAAGHDELVDDDLGAVHEVAELRLPEHERVGSRDRVAVLERERSVLRERGVVDLERRGGVGEILKRRERLSGSRIVEHRVAVRERAALGVLAGEPDRNAFFEQRPERERLRVAPVDSTLAQALSPALELPGELWIDLEAVRHANEL